MALSAHSLAGAPLVGVVGSDLAYLAGLSDAAFARLVAPGYRWVLSGSSWTYEVALVHSLSGVGGGAFVALDNTGARITDKRTSGTDSPSGSFPAPALPLRGQETLPAAATAADAFVGQVMAVMVGVVLRVGRLTSDGFQVLLPDGSSAEHGTTAAEVVEVAPNAPLSSSFLVHSNAPDGGLMLGVRTAAPASGPRAGTSYAAAPTARTLPASTLGGLAATPRDGTVTLALRRPPSIAYQIEHWELVVWK